MHNKRELPQIKIKTSFLFITLIISFLLLSSCQTLPELDSNGNPIPTYTVEETLDFVDIEEPYKYVFLRLYDVDYNNPFYIANLLKFGIRLTEVNDVEVSHAAINFTLDDNFWGLTSGGKFKLEKESCLDVKSNKFLKKVDPKTSTQLTYAIKVSEEDYYKAKKMVEDYASNKHLKYDVLDNLKFAHFNSKRRFRTKIENRSMEDMDYPEEDEKYNDPDFVETDFVCSTFCAYVLKENIDYIGKWFSDNNINYEYVGVSDIPSIPGVVKLFESKFLDYEIACESFIALHPEFEQYYKCEPIEVNREEKLE